MNPLQSFWKKSVEPQSFDPPDLDVKNAAVLFCLPCFAQSRRRQQVGQCANVKQTRNRVGWICPFDFNFATSSNTWSLSTTFQSFVAEFLSRTGFFVIGLTQWQQLPYLSGHVFDLFCIGTLTWKLFTIGWNRWLHSTRIVQRRGAKLRSSFCVGFVWFILISDISDI